VGPHIPKNKKVFVMALFGKKEKETGVVDDLVPKKSDFVEKIAEQKIKEKEYDDVVLETKMRKFHHEMTQNEQIAALKAELAKKDKEIEELKEEIRSLKGKAGGIGIGGGPAPR
jgi:predicted RNase H-like nuclease (RuvC/YqgF family)